MQVFQHPLQAGVQVADLASLQSDLPGQAFQLGSGVPGGGKVSLQGGSLLHLAGELTLQGVPQVGRLEQGPGAAQAGLARAFLDGGIAFLQRQAAGCQGSQAGL